MAPKAAKGDKPPAKGDKPPAPVSAPPPKPKSVQPKHEVGTRKGCRRYRWELKDSNKEFWLLGHAEVKILSVDLFNDLFSFAFLVGAMVFAVRSRQSMHLHYLLGVILMGLAAFFAFIDVCLQRNHFRGKRAKKHMLVPPPGKEKGPQQGKEPEPAKPLEAAKPPEPAKGKK
uniref:CKLF like MARVEL transmembrane domain containing 2 n=1 Tax=Cebus imitator TaxID=2715852 RepID=A0A2K5RI84_CEBIM